MSDFFKIIYMAIVGDMWWKFNTFVICINGNYTQKLPVTVAVRSEAWVLAGWLLGSWVRIPLKAWMFVRVFLCRVVLCRYRPCDGLITHPRGPTTCLTSSKNLLYVRRPGSKTTVEPREENTQKCIIKLNNY
jgi:hypothetical protein